MKIGIIVLAMGLLMSPAVMAHDGHGLMFASASLEGLFHPLLGLDHLLAMLGMGASLSAMSRRAVLGVSVAILLALIAGMLGAQVFIVTDPLLASALLVTALLLLRGQGGGMFLRIALTLAFSAMHGMAHGTVAPQAEFTAYAMGVAAGSWLLFMVGQRLAQHFDLKRRMNRFCLGGGLGLAALSLMYGL